MSVTEMVMEPNLSQPDSVLHTSNTDPWAGQVFIRLNAMGDWAVGGEGQPQRSGKTKTVHIKSDNTVIELKLRAEIPASYRLMYAGKYLSDNATLAECGIKREATMDVLCRLLGGTGGRGTAAGSPMRAEESFVQAQRQFDKAHRLCAELIAGFDSTCKHLQPQQATGQAEITAAAASALCGNGLLAEAKLQVQPEQASDRLPDQVAPAIPHELMLALAKLDDAALRREFDKHADLDLAAGTGNEGGRRMSKDGLAELMQAKGLAHGDAEVKRVLARVDTNGNGEIDFGEFCALARANSDLEQVLQSMHFECVLAAYFPSGTTLENLGKMDDAQLSAVVDQSRDVQIQLLKELRAQLAAVGSVKQPAEGGKFSSELRGGTLEDFYKGIAGPCGEPDADLEAGMRKEHTESADANVEFSTPNYGITTTPRIEFELVASGGSKCEAAPGDGEAVVAKGMRGCFKASGLKWRIANLCSDPTAPHFTSGLQWQVVGAAEPKEGRRLANAKLQDALEKLKGDVMRFAQEDVDAFDFTDLRSKDFIEAGGRYFQPAASSAQILENAGLAEALSGQTEFTQGEWDAFGISSLRMSHLVKAGDAYYCPAGTEEHKDVRVVRPLEYYGSFSEDGRLKWGVGDEVAVGEVCTVQVEGRYGDPEIKEIPKGAEGVVLEINAGVLQQDLYWWKPEGAAKIAFRGPVSEEVWVRKEQFYRLSPLPNERDTRIQRRVKLGKLRRCEVIALVMYTGECLC